jgi:chemotaxis protein methyltransferase CheR
MVLDEPTEGQTQTLDQEAYRLLSHDIRVHLGIDLESYKPQQVWRRVTSFARLHGYAGASDLRPHLATDPGLRAALRDNLTINVSEFFRDGRHWAELERRFLRPALLAGRPLRIWSAGCSTGFEPFSIAMLAWDVVPQPSVRITATDIDEMALERTRAAHFSEGELASLSSDRRKYLIRDAGGWVVRPDLRQVVEIRRHDLTREPPPGRFDLIVCRNVLIYFTEATKDRAYTGFEQALRPGGMLFVGATEILTRPDRHRLRSVAPCLYERI